MPAAVGVVAEGRGLQTALWIMLHAPLAIIIWARPEPATPMDGNGAL